MLTILALVGERRGKWGRKAGHMVWETGITLCRAPVSSWSMTRTWVCDAGCRDVAQGYTEAMRELKAQPRVNYTNWGTSTGFQGQDWYLSGSQGTIVTWHLHFSLCHHEGVCVCMGSHHHGPGSPTPAHRIIRPSGWLNGETDSQTAFQWR